MADLPPTPAPPGPEPVKPLPFFRRLHAVPFVLAALAIVFFLDQIVAGGVTLLLAGGSITANTIQWVRWSTLIGQLLFLLAPTLVLTHLRYGRILQPLRLRWPTVPQVVVVLVGVFALQQVLQGYMLLQEAIPLPSGLQRWVDMIKDMFEATYRVLVTARTPLELVLVICTVAVVPAISEELLFRGLVQRDLESVVSGRTSAILAGVIFGLYHLNPFSLVPLITLGVAFGLIVYRSGNITLAMAAHFLNNFLASIALYLNMNEDFLLTAPDGGETVAAAVLNTIVFGMVFVGAMYYFVRITRPSQQA
ncbi:MAG: CPBP family intramembrane metalloprotease [Bacteroidetes bacterium]|nr:CPBP family intramembrane metalloprotease [Bacteroidota bacterium]